MIPCAVLSEHEFRSAIRTIDLQIVWIFKEVEYIDTFNSKRTFEDGFEIIQPYMTSIYIWYYNWPIRFVDWESSGIEVFSLDELQEEIYSNPLKFTDDILYMIDRYKHLLIPLI